MFAKTNNNNNPLKISVSNSVRVFFCEVLLLCCFFCICTLYPNDMVLYFELHVLDNFRVVCKKQSHLVLLFLQNLIFEKIYSHLKN